MKILIFLKSMDGGTGTFALNLLKLRRYFKGMPCAIHIACLEKPTYRRVDIHAVEYLNTAGTYPLRYRVSIMLFFRFLKELRAYRQVLKNEHPDIILSVDIHANLISILYRLFFFDKTLLIINNRNCLSQVLRAKASTLTQWVLTGLVSATYNRADAICVVSKGVQQDLRTNFRILRPMKVIGNGIHVAINQQPKKYRLPLRMVSVARFTAQKDFKTLLEAYSLVRNVNPACTLTLIGDGPEKEHILQMIDTLGLKRSVILRPWSNHAPATYAKADMFILSSLWEGFPNVLLEAMSRGLPVVSTDTPHGPAEVLGNNRYGLLVPMNDKDRMSYAILQLLQKRTLYKHYADKALERARYYNMGKMLDSYFRLITEITSEK